MKKLLIILTLFLTSFIFANEENNKKNIQYFIKKAWENSSSIKQAEFDIKKYHAMQLQAISVYSPKINSMSWLAPMYGVEIDKNDPWKTEIDLNNWGPYFSFNISFIQPIFAFTRVISGIRAAQDGKNAARADVEITKWNAAKEVRLYYYGIIFGKTMLKTIKMADDILTEAIKKSEEMINSGETEVTEVDLSKLKYFYSQIPINRSYAEKSIEMAQEALFLTTGERLEEADIPSRLEIENTEFYDIDNLIKIMLKNRPLLKKLNYGISATRHLMNLEFKSMLPALFMGGFLRYSIAPGVGYHENKFLNSFYNSFNSEGPGVDYGLLFGLFWQFDPMMSIAKGLEKKAELDKLVELYNYAIKGFPVQLQKVLYDMQDLRVKIDNNKDAIKNAQTWMFFAANAYAIGGGEARDIMEGLAAYVKAKTDYYQAIYDYNKLLGELCKIIGQDINEL